MIGIDADVRHFLMLGLARAIQKPGDTPSAIGCKSMGSA